MGFSLRPPAEIWSGTARSDYLAIIVFVCYVWSHDLAINTLLAMHILLTFAVLAKIVGTEDEGTSGSAPKITRPMGISCAGSGRPCKMSFPP